MLIENEIKKIVIVDDDDTQLMLLELLLSQMGIKPVKFSNPIKAYEYVKTNKIDILISDFNMPEVTGIELIREVKKIYKKLSTGIVSAMRDDDGSLKRKCESLNTNLLLKPFDATAFQNFMNSFMEDDVDKIMCIRKNDKECMLRDKVASTYCINCCLDDIEEEKEVIQSAIDAIDDFFPSETMLRHVATKLSFVANTMNSSKDPELEELLHIIRQLTVILYEYSEKILNDADITILVSSYFSIISEWFDNTFIKEASSMKANNYTDSIRADFQTIEMALGISEVDFDKYDDLDDLFF